MLCARQLSITRKDENVGESSCLFALTGFALVVRPHVLIIASLALDKTGNFMSPHRKDRSSAS